MTSASPTFCRLIELVCERVDEREEAARERGFTVELCQEAAATAPDQDWNG